jgi:lipopolysaccharide/colanic/teichoic acid biosynthesis glycosyltransferase
MKNFTDENFLQSMLSLEKRRCERTGARFALMLIDIEELSRALTAAAVEELAEAIGTAMRETDIIGWYQPSAVVGVILTTLNGTDRATLEPVILERTKGVLSLNLDPDQMKRIRISCHLFPEEDNAGAFHSDRVQPDFKSKRLAVLKRTLDVFGSLLALVVLSPVFLIIAVLVKRSSAGPVLFRQKRVGQFGREFTFLKFRSMFASNDPTIHKEYVQNLIAKKVDGASGTYKIRNDPRVTPVGRFLRKTSLDELPQFINVLKGEMSLVGPRPPIPYELENYSLWHRRRVLEAKPGITGEWQVSGRSRTSFDDMVRMDLRYIRNQSLWLDLKILCKTPFAVFNGDGAF